MNAGQSSRALTDRYRIERELGAGGMATVYLAEDLKLSSLERDWSGAPSYFCGLINSSNSLKPRRARSAVVECHANFGTPCWWAVRNKRTASGFSPSVARIPALQKGDSPFSHSQSGS